MFCIEFVCNIIWEGLRFDLSVRFGIGINSSFVIEMIEWIGYVKVFKYNGKVYKVVL